MKSFFTWILLLALLAACLTGCTSSQTSQEETEPPVTEAPAEDTGDATDAAEEDAAEDTTETETVPDIAVVDTMEVTLYLPNEQADAFEEVTETVDATPQAIVDALIAHNALPEGTAVNSFSMRDNGTETQEGDVVSYTAGDTLTIDLDLSAEFAEAAASTGTSGEQMLLGSLVNTMLTAYNADELNLTCDGAVLETGHSIYDEPLTFFELP